MSNIRSFPHTTWNCKYHIGFAPTYRRQVFYGEKKKAVGEYCGKYVDTVGKNMAKIAEYIRQQLAEDKLGEQLSLPYPGSPFTGRK